MPKLDAIARRRFVGTSLSKIEQTTQSGEGFTVRIRGNTGIERHLRVEFDSPPAHLIFRSGTVHPWTKGLDTPR